MLETCVYIGFRFFNGATKHEKQRTESNIYKSLNKPFYTWVDALLHLREKWVKQFVTTELYNELKLEFIAIKIKHLR